MKYVQRVGLLARIEYDLNEDVQLQVTFRSLTKTFKRAVDLRFLNPSPIEERVFSVKTAIFALVFFVLGCAWIGYGALPANALNIRIGSILLGMVACDIGTYLALQAYLRSRPLVGFVNTVTKRAEVIVYMSRSHRDEAVQFIGELRSRIARQQYESSQPHVNVDDFVLPKRTGTDG